MKKRFGIISMIVVLLVCFAVCFTACGSKDKGNGDSINIADDYNYAQIEAKINEMAGTNGVFVKVRVSSSSSGEADETYYVAFGVKNHIYYYLTETSEAYYDLSDNTKGVVYEKNAAGTWDKDIYYYGTYYTKENMDAYANALSTGVFGWLGYYHYLGAGEGTKSDTTFLNRSCTKYSISTNYVGYGASYSQEVIIDKETGACLKYAASASAGGESGSVSIECTEFNTSWNPTIPTNIAHTEEHGTQGQGGTGGQGGSGGSGEGGQGGQGEVVVSSNFADKGFGVQSISPNTNEEVNYSLANATAKLFSDSTFEIAMNDGADVMFGNYTISTDDLTATLIPSKAYDVYGGYSHEIPPFYASITITYDEDDAVYTMPFSVYTSSGLVNVTLTLIVEVSGPTRAILPTDPNGDSFDSQYQIEQEDWEDIFMDYSILLNGNCTIAYSSTYQSSEATGTLAINGTDMRDEYVNTLYYVRTGGKDSQGLYPFNMLYQSGDWQTLSVTYDLTDQFYAKTGIFTIDFTSKARYQSTSHYYSVSTFEYLPNGSSQSYHVENYRVWFENGKLKKITFSIREQYKSYEFNYSAYGTTVVDVPGGGGGSSSSTTTIFEGFGNISSLQATALSMLNTGIYMTWNWDGDEITIIGKDDIVSINIYGTQGYIDLSDRENIVGYEYDTYNSAWDTEHNLSLSEAKTAMCFDVIFTYYYMEYQQATREQTTRTIDGTVFDVYRYDFGENVIIELEKTTGILVYYNDGDGDVKTITKLAFDDDVVEPVLPALL